MSLTVLMTCVLCPFDSISTTPKTTNVSFFASTISLAQVPAYAHCSAFWVCDLLFLSPSAHWSPVLYSGHKDTRLVRGEEREEEREREEKREGRGGREITDPGL